MKKEKVELTAEEKAKKKAKTRAAIYTHRGFYVMFLPVFIFALIFCYAPMVGVLLAFTNYNGIKAITPEIFVGLENFQRMFSMSAFWTAFRNTLEISIIKLILTTGFAVIISILLNEIISLKFKKVVQTIIYLPHFMSWVVVASLFSLILAPTQNGLVNTFLVQIGVLDSSNMIYFLGSNKWWKPVYYIINLWKETGWQTVIFMATLSGLNTDMYEAAGIDGANRAQKMWYITFPALANTILTVLILNLARIMNLFESVFVLQNDAVLSTSNVLETYIYYQAFNSGAIPNYGYTAAVGLFKSVVAAILVLSCNELSKKVRDGRGIV
ncbi:MAG: ABC transporter permease subunit [Lachnospiraceae bacterium]|nr:ABC transporter permease subunit [Lachnospiraceae bacterium]